MQPLFLATKVRIPPQSHHTVRRSRLVETLERGIPQYKLILISAPAGFGKTTLLSQWAASSGHSAAWLSIGLEDNDFERFLRYLLTSWEVAQPSIMDSQLGVVLGAMIPDRETVLSAFINTANDTPDHLVFVLDDYHLIEAASIHQALTFLLDHLPPKVHFVLAGRGEPPLPLARYRARGELLELRAEDLQFQREETADFLNAAMKLDLSDDAISGLQANLEGWIAGLQLVAVSLRRRHEVGDLVISGRHRFIADYLRADVLAPLPAQWQAFLLKTSILDRLCGSLCDAVTNSHDGQEMLEALERENLFIVLLDDRREWFRYHHLFADFLVQELNRKYPDEVKILHRRAAHWYLDHDLPEFSFRHGIAGEDIELVVEILDRYVNAKLNGGEFRTVGQWVDAIPPEWYSIYPGLGLARVGFLAFSGEFEDCMRHLNEVEQRLTPAESEEKRWQMSRLVAVRCLVACTLNDLTQAETYANQALHELPEENLSFRPGIYGALGDTYRKNGRWAEAKECYISALSVTNSPQNRFMSAHAYGALADLELRQGHLRNADSYWRQALGVIQDRETWGQLPLPLIGWVYIRRGELLYEWNELEQAWDYVSRGLARAELGGDVRALIAGYLLAGHVRLTDGDTEAAVEYLERARRLVENTGFTDWISRFERFQLELWLTQDQLRAAVNWSDEMLRDSGIEERPESEVAQLAMARVLFVKGDVPALDRARALLEQLLRTAEDEGRMGVVVEALALQALANWRRGERAEALTALERALRLAEPEGYIRLFADFGLPMARLLQEARARAVLPDYVEKLLAGFGTDPAGSIAEKVALPEPLTPREQEILELIAAGLTNQEIADKLVISSETVKKHAGSIYGKLGVSNRTEAVARARELDLLV